MTKGRISVKEVLIDIRGGLPDSELMAKYDLSQKGLKTLFGKLVELRALSQAQLDMREAIFQRGNTSQPEVIQKTEEQTADAPKAVSRDSSLLLAIEEGNLTEASRLIDEGADLEEKDAEGATPLIVAAKQGCKEIVELLLNRGADYCAKGADGKTAVAWADINQHHEIRALIFDKKHQDLVKKQIRDAFRPKNSEAEKVQKLPVKPESTAQLSTASGIAPPPVVGEPGPAATVRDSSNPGNCRPLTDHHVKQTLGKEESNGSTVPLGGAIPELHGNGRQQSRSEAPRREAQKEFLMNENQKKVLIAVAAIILAMLVYPPFHVTGSGGQIVGQGHGWIFDPPHYAATVDVGVLVTQWLGALIVGAIAFFVFKSK